MGRARVVILVPWRGGDDRREWCWDIVQPYLYELGWPLFLGDRPGPWSRSAAINEAARAAGRWDVALIADADTIPDLEAVRRAAVWVADTGGAARPHYGRWMLNQQQSLTAAQRGPHAVGARQFTIGGGLLVVARETWELVGGFDESFTGWGREDSEFNLRVLRASRWDLLPGEAWHLWHTPDRLNPNNERIYRELRSQYAADVKRWPAANVLRDPWVF